MAPSPDLTEALLEFPHHSSRSAGRKDLLYRKGKMYNFPDWVFSEQSTFHPSLSAQEANLPLASGALRAFPGTTALLSGTNNSIFH